MSSQNPVGRSIFDRMTNPTAAESNVNARLASLSRAEIDRVMNHFGLVMEHLAAQRDDLVVRRTQDATGWTIRVEMRALVESPVQVVTSPPNPLIPNPTHPAATERMKQGRHPEG